MAHGSAGTRSRSELVRARGLAVRPALAGGHADAGVATSSWDAMIHLSGDYTVARSNALQPRIRHRLSTPDYDPWAGYEWPDRSHQLERARRRKRQSELSVALKAHSTPLLR